MWLHGQTHLKPTTYDRYEGAIRKHINPIWAEVIGRAYPDITDVQAYLWDKCALSINSFRPEYRDPIGNLGRIKPDGRGPLVPKPEDMLVMVGGGEGGLHAAMLHSWGTCLTVTRPVVAA